MRSRAVLSMTSIEIVAFLFKHVVRIPEYGSVQRM